MAISRAQMEEQLKGFENGGINDVDPFGDTTTMPTDPTDPFALFGMPTQEKITEYSDLLKALGRQETRTNQQKFYDLASTVGQAMLTADPRAGAFRSLGLGLAQFSENERKRRRQQEQEDRAIALKAFELAKTDEDKSASLLFEYRKARAKKIGEAKFRQYVVKNPDGITVRNEKIPFGATVFLTQFELPMFLQDVEEEREGQELTPVTDFGQATYMSPEDALQQFRLVAPELEKSNPAEFERIVDKFSTTDEKLIGKSFIVNQSYTDFSVLNDAMGNPITVVAKPNKDYGEVPMAGYREASEKTLVEEAQNLRQLRSSVIPDLKMALALLLDGKAETGPFKGRIANLKFTLADAFGVEVEGMEDLEVILSIAMRLAPTLRVAGSGSTSDMEFKAMLAGLLSAEKTTKSNYLAAYMLVQRADIQERQLEILQSLLYDDSVRSPTEITEAMKEVDTNLFEIYTGDTNDEEQLRAWTDALPRGAVIKNNPLDPLYVDKNGQPITDVYIIKGMDF